MGRHGWLGAVGWLVWAVLAGSVGSAAAQPRRDLNSLARTLDLTPAGVPSWLDALGVSADRSAPERLLAVTCDGRTVGARDGGVRHVTLGSELDDRLHTAEGGIALIHNHPLSVGLSADDLVQLAKPGVAAIVAIGHDGSVYMAAAGPRYNRDLFEQTQYASARAGVDRKLREELADRAITPALIDAHLAHVVALALAKAGVIEYRAVLAPDRRGSYDQARVAFGHAIVAGAGRVAHDRARRAAPLDTGPLAERGNRC